MQSVDLAGVQGVRWIPDSPSGIAALVLAGSSGRVDSARAELLARQGVIAESIRWFGGPGQNTGPWDIPLETFLERVADLAQTADRVLVLGTSFGSEAALLTGVHSPHVDDVVAFAPSDVVWAGIRPDESQTSHWSLDGQTLPYVEIADGWESDTDPPAFVGLYEESRRRFPDQVAAAAIPVERIDQVLLVAGGNDQVWPSVAMAEAIKARRQQFDLETTLIVEPEAGHRTVLPGEPVVTGGVRMQRGGRESSDIRLGAAAWEHVTRLL